MMQMEIKLMELCHSEARGVYDGELNYQINIQKLNMKIYFICILDEEKKR